MTSLVDAVFSIDCRDDGTTYTLSCAGELDAAATREMRAALLLALNSRRVRITVDLSLVAFIDSGGVNYLLLAQKAAEIAALEITFVEPLPAAMRTLRIAGVDQLLAFAR